MKTEIPEIRRYFKEQLKKENFVIDKTGVKTIELLGASFIADENTIFGKPNEEYLKKELNWYNSMSRNVHDIEEPVPEIWKNISSKAGEINSNYGWCAYSEENGFQFSNVLEHLVKDENTRRASMIYTRPEMHVDYCKDGMSDFMCTHVVDYMIRDDKLHCVVYMRSNDVVFGYRNDWYWQKHVLDSLSKLLGIESGDIHWNASSLHVYERHFNLIV